MPPADSGPSIPLSVAAATADSEDVYGTDSAVLQLVAATPVETPATKEEVERGFNDALNRIYQIHGVPKFALPTSTKCGTRLPVQRRSDSEAVQATTSGAPQAVVLLPQQQQQQRGGAGSLRRTASYSAVQLPLRVVACNGPGALLNRQCDQQQLGNTTLLPLLLPATVESASSLTSTVPLVPLVPAAGTAVRHTYQLTSPRCSVGSSPIRVSASVPAAAAAATVSVRGPLPSWSPVAVVAARPPTSSATEAGNRFPRAVTGGLNVVRPPLGAFVSQPFRAPQPRPASSTTPAAAPAGSQPPAVAARAPAAAAAGPAAVVPQKQLRNRAAAAKCREKRLQQERKMSERLVAMTAENARLTEEERQLRQRVDKLERLMERHRSDNGACRLVSGEIGVGF